MKTLNLRRTAASTLLAAAALLGHVSTNAAVVQYDFSTTIDFSTGTPADGTSFSGSFSYDRGVGDPGPYGLTAFSFVFNGISYALGDLASGAEAVFDGEKLLGLDASSNDGVIAFVPAEPSISLAASFAFDIIDGATGSGDFAARPANGGNTVPEPATLLLVAGLLPLIGIGAARRQRDAG